LSFSSAAISSSISKAKPFRRGKLMVNIYGIEATFTEIHGKNNQGNKVQKEPKLTQEGE
jgi:hypothetical protein